MFDNLYQLMKYQVNITAIENGYLVAVQKPFDQAEAIRPMVEVLKAQNKGDEWERVNEASDDRPDNNIHFFKKDEPEKLMAFLSNMFITE